MKYNLYLAFTPLHLKIINSIPKKNHSILIALSKRNLRKYINSYIDKKEFCRIYDYQALFFNPLELIKISFKYKKIHQLYVGNFKFFNFRLIQLLIRYEGLITFDDGIGALTESYFNLNDSTIKERLYKFLKIDIKSIMKNHVFHYSIYNTQGTVFDGKIVSLKLKDIKRRFSYDGNVLLTTDKSEVGTMTINDERNLIERIITTLDIDYIIHHPSKKFNLNVLERKIINEPFLSDDIVSNSSFHHVYSLSASSILGINKLESFPEKNTTYLANRDAPVSKLLQTKTKINFIAFEDL